MRWMEEGLRWSAGVAETATGSTEILGGETTE
jgi:hypothetical protein